MHLKCINEGLGTRENLDILLIMGNSSKTKESSAVDVKREKITYLDLVRVEIEVQKRRLENENQNMLPIKIDDWIYLDKK
jgi:hypothetical protein